MINLSEILKIFNRSDILKDKELDKSYK